MATKELMKAADAHKVAEEIIRKGESSVNLGMLIVGATVKMCAEALEHYEAAGKVPAVQPERMGELTPWDLFAAAFASRGGTAELSAELADDLLRERAKRATSGGL